MILLPVVAMVFLALFPQILFLLTGEKWNGSYFVSNYDETAYSAYVNALIQGEPRMNDPFVGLAESAATPQPETLYSIQFISAYAIALPAKFLGISVSTAFILLAIFISAFSILAIHKLLLDATGDDLIAIVGPLVILCFGTAVAFEGELRNLIVGRLLADFLPFLRRYQPGFAFPFFFVFCLLFNRAAARETVKSTLLWSLAAGAVFALLVFSYFYLWTAAAAWLGCFVLVSLWLRRSGARNVLIAAGIVGVFAIASLVPYFLLLSQRSTNLDSVQLLDMTRMPQLASPSMIIGLIVAVVAIVMFRKSEKASGPGFVVLLSSALTPVVLFNQQVVTGRSLQPVHYELFIANYLVLFAAVILLSLFTTSGDGTQINRRRVLVYVGIIAFGWGLFEAYGSASRAMTVAEIRDGSVPAIKAAAAETARKQVILATNFVTADFIPSLPNARSYWNPHTSSAGGITVEENKRLFYKYLYFSGYTERDLGDALGANSFEVTAAIFGAERALPSLVGGSKKITPDEIRTETLKFADFVRTFSETDAFAPAIDRLIVPADPEPALANIDRWYTRDQGETFGLFKLYRLTLRRP